jgi:hypothetical protein
MFVVVRAKSNVSPPLLASSFKSNSRLEAENAALRHQLTVLQGKVRGRVQFTNSDRLFFIQLYRWFLMPP